MKDTQRLDKTDDRSSRKKWKTWHRVYEPSHVKMGQTQHGPKLRNGLSMSAKSMHSLLSFKHENGHNSSSRNNFCRRLFSCHMIPDNVRTSFSQSLFLKLEKGVNARPSWREAAHILQARTF